MKRDGDDIADAEGNIRPEIARDLGARTLLEQWVHLEGRPAYRARTGGCLIFVALLAGAVLVSVRFIG